MAEWLRVRPAGHSSVLEPVQSVPRYDLSRGDKREIQPAVRKDFRDGLIRNAVALAILGPTPYLALMTSWNFAVSTYCWNLVTLPSLTSQTWQTCASMLFPVALYLPL